MIFSWPNVKTRMLNVDAVASHTFSLLFDDEAQQVLDMVNKKALAILKPVPRKFMIPAYLETIHNLLELRETMARVFEGGGHDVVLEWVISEGTGTFLNLPASET